MDIEKLKQLTADNKNDALMKRLTERPKPPLGEYIQWYVDGETVKEFESSGLVGIQLTCLPLKVEGQPNSAAENMKVNHIMFFARDANAATGTEEFGGFNTWMDVLDGTQAEPRGLGPIPPRGLFNKGAPGGTIGGKQVSGDEVEAQGHIRTAYVRRLQGILLEELIANDGQLKEELFLKNAFYACAGLDKTGKYINLVTKVGKGYKNFSPTLPAGEKYGF